MQIFAGMVAMIKALSEKDKEKKCQEKKKKKLKQDVQEGKGSID